MIIDFRGRIWKDTDGLKPIEGDYPPLVPYGRIVGAFQSTSITLTQEGHIFDIRGKRVIEGHHRIRRLESPHVSTYVYAITEDGTLLMINNEWESTIIDTDVKEVACGRTKIAYIKTDGRVIFTDMTATENRQPVGRRDEANVIPDIDEVIRIIERTVITKRHIYQMNMRGEFMATIKIPIGVDPIEVIELYTADDHNPIIYVLLDILGELHSIDDDGNYAACANTIIIQMGKFCKWVKLIDNGDCSLLINEIGEAYHLDPKLFIHSSDIPTEIFAARPSKVKNARNK